MGRNKEKKGKRADVEGRRGRLVVPGWNVVSLRDDGVNRRGVPGKFLSYERYHVASTVVVATMIVQGRVVVDRRGGTVVVIIISVMMFFEVGERNVIAETLIPDRRPADFPCLFAVVDKDTKFRELISQPIGLVIISIQFIPKALREDGVDSGLVDGSPTVV